MSSKFNKLSNVADVIDSLHKTPSYSNQGKPMVRCTDVKYGKLNLSSSLKVSAKVFAEFSRRYTPKKGDIIITRVGSYGITAIVDKLDFCLGQNTSAIAPKKINPRYLYLVLNSRFIKNQIESSVVGSTQKTLSLKAINNLDIPRFETLIEDKIAKIGGNFDDKIELNTQINQTLEQIAQALFKSWFVDFDPVKAKIDVLEAGGTAEAAELAAMGTIAAKSPEQLADMQQSQPKAYQQLAQTAALFPATMQDSELGEIPKGWTKSTIGEEVYISGGGTPSTSTIDFWRNGSINWTTPKDLSRLRYKVLTSTERQITEAGLKKISSGLLPVNTILMSSRAPVGYLAIAKIPVAINQGYIAMQPKKNLSPEFILQWATANIDEIKQRSSGTTFTEISKKNFKPIPIVVPDEKLTKKYSIYAKDIYEKIHAAIEETRALSSIRDTLLPKLLSGQIDLSSINKSSPNSL